MFMNLVQLPGGVKKSVSNEALAEHAYAVLDEVKQWLEQAKAKYKIMAD